MSEPPKGEERRIPAHAVSRGIGVGHIIHLDDQRETITGDKIAGPVSTELDRLNVAVEQSLSQLTELERILQSAVSGILGTHAAIIENSSLVENARRVIERDKVSAESALRTVGESYVEAQRNGDDPRFREKALDIEDVIDRIIRALGDRPRAFAHGPGAVYVARELRPSTVIELAETEPAGLITQRGGWTSHTSIIARDLKLPMVTGVTPALLTTGDMVVVDGFRGQIILDPEPRTLKGLGTSAMGFQFNHGKPGGAAGVATLDGVEVVLRANARSVERYTEAKDLGAVGIGLLRSETVIPLDSGPTEEAQYSAYRRIADAVGEDGVKIRTFDFGVENQAATETNPALGLRSIRLSLANPSDFRVQIRAILRASHDRNVDIVLPMVSGVAEIRRCIEIIEEEQRALSDAGAASGTPGIGAMIEVPSAVLTAHEIARKVDFLCLGTNDLVQYLLAVDRDNELVADWYQTLHPAVFRAIREVVRAGRETDTPVIACGEMAGSPFYVPLLIGFGLRELSVNVNSISMIRELISSITAVETTKLVSLIGTAETSIEVEQILHDFYSANWAHLFPPGLLDLMHR